MHMELLTRWVAQWEGLGHHCCMEPTKSFATLAVGAPWVTKDSFGVGGHTAAILQG